MIIVKLLDSLGNQMFQFAAAKALSLRLKTDLRLDLTWFDHHQGFELARVFAVEKPSASAKEKKSEATIIMSLERF